MDHPQSDLPSRWTMIPRTRIRGRSARRWALGGGIMAAVVVGILTAQVAGMQRPRSERGTRIPRDAERPSASERSATAAPGTQSSGSSRRFVYSKYGWADIRDFGARPDGSDCAPAIQAAHDALLQPHKTLRGYPNPATAAGIVHIPAGRWTIRTPIWLDGDSITLQGDGSRVSTIAAAGYFHPLLLGVRRRQLWKRDVVRQPIFAADHRFDLYGILDESAVPARHRAWGVTTRSPSSGSKVPDHFISFWAVPPAIGFRDQWRSPRTLCIDACFARPPKGQPIFGMGAWYDPSPWVLEQHYEPAVKHRVFRFTFATAEGGPGSDLRIFTFGNVDALTGTVRLTVQVDFTTNDESGRCALRAWINGTEQTIQRGQGTRLTKATATEPSFTAADNLHWRPNKYAPFQIGTGDLVQNDWRPPGHPELRGDLALAGLYIGTAADYISNRAGHQVRADGGPLNDAYRYLGTGRSRAHLMARLSLDDPPKDDYPGRLVWMRSGEKTADTNCAGLFLYRTDEEQHGVVSYLTLRGLQIQAGQGVGQCVSIGQCIDVTIDDVIAREGWQGVGSMNYGAVYDIHIRNGCEFSGADCGYYGFNQIIRCDGLKRVNVNNALVRLVGCDARFGPLLTGGYTHHPSCMVEILDSGYASIYEFTSLISDQEGGHTEPTIYCERHRTGGTTLRVQHVGPGIQDGKTPVIKLVDRFPGARGLGPGYLDLRRVLTAHGLIVETEGDWEGTVEDCPSDFNEKTQFVKTNDPNGRVGIVSIHYLDDLPKAGTWTAGAHRIIRRNPQPGDWTEARCVRTGTYGTDHPPAWSVLNLLPPPSSKTSKP
jgi:hypothetical protein